MLALPEPLRTCCACGGAVFPSGMRTIPLLPLSLHVVAGLVVGVVLLCLLVGVVVTINRQFEAMAGQIAVLESRVDYDQLVLLDVALVGRGGGVV